MMKKLIIQISIFILGLFLIEGVLRLLNYEPYSYKSFYIKSSPKSFIINDSSLGFNLSPGTYSVNANGVKFKCSNNEFGLREVIPKVKSDYKIGFFGCSFTFGWGVNNDENFCSLIQQETSKEIINYGIPGTGTIQSLLKLKTLELNKNLPNEVIIVYCGFHAERNILSKYYSTTINKGILPTQNINNTAYFPFGSIKNNSLSINYTNTKDLYRFWPLRENSSLINSLQTSYEGISYDPEYEDLVTLKIFEEIQKLCFKNKVKLKVIGITKNERTQKMMDLIKSKGITGAFNAIDFTNKKHTFQNKDKHPNKLSHKILKNKITQSIINITP